MCGLVCGGTPGRALRVQRFLRKAFHSDLQPSPGPQEMLQLPSGLSHETFTARRCGPLSALDSKLGFWTNFFDLILIFLSD